MMIKTVNLGELISPAKVRRCNDDEYPVLSMTMHDGIVLQSERFKKSLASLDQSNYKVVSRGQLVVGFPIDEGVIYVQNAADEGIMSPAYGVWDIHAEKVLPEYLECCLHSPQSMSYYMSKLKGTTARRRSITTEDLLSLPISLPDKSEQRRRLSLLSSCKDTISKSEQQLAKLDELVKSRFVELTEMAPTTPTRMGDIATYLNGYAFKPDQWEDKGLPIIRIQNLNNPDAAYNYYSGELAEKYLVLSGDVLVSWATHLEAYVWKGESAWLNQHIFKVVFDKMDVDKIYFVFATEEALRQAFKNAHGFKPTMEHIKKADFDNAVVKLPPLPVQREFSRFAQQVDKSKLAVKQSLEKLEMLKKSLMQQYFG